MSVTAINASSGPFAGNGATTAFPFTFDAGSADEVAVLVDEVTQASGYTVALNAGGNGGTVTFSVAPVTGTEIFVRSDPSFEQPIAFANAGPFLAETHDEGLDQAARRDIYLLGEVRDAQDDLVDNAAAISAEAGARADADTILQNAIDAETNGRQTADAALLAALPGIPTNATLNAANRTILAALDTSLPAYLTEDGREGMFEWAAGDQSALVDADPFQGLYVAPTSETTGASGAWVRQRFNGDLWADWFGMPKDGSEIGAYSTSMSALMSAQGGGGVIHLNGDGIYGLGTQIDNGPNPAEYGGGTMRFAPLYGYPFLFDGCTKPVKIDGHGATVRCIAGKKFGAYEADGTASTGLSTTISKQSTPYFAMVRALACEALVEIENINLDGNVLNAVIGGQFGDTGWQIPAYGIRLDNCTGGLRLAYVDSHHHPLDGLLINGVCTDPVSDPDENIEIVGCNIVCNGRNNTSIVQGKGIRICATNLSWAGKAAVGSDTNGPTAMNPGAGVDIEAESGPIRDVEFSDCEATNCSGAGLTGIGDIDRVNWHRGKIVGSTNTAIWGLFPGLRFHDPVIVGHVTNPYPNADARLATQFIGGLITDDPALSPTGTVWMMGGSNTIIDAGGSGALNVLLDGITIDVTNSTRILPFGGGFKMRNLRAKQTSTATFYMNGTAEGTNVIEGGGLWGYAPRVLNGETFYNGDNVLVHTVSHNFGTLVAGASVLVAFPADGYNNYLEIDGLQYARVAWLSPWPFGVVVEPSMGGGFASTIRVTNVSGSDQALGTLTCMLKVVPFNTSIEALP